MRSAGGSSIYEITNEYFIERIKIRRNKTKIKEK